MTFAGRNEIYLKILNDVVPKSSQDARKSRAIGACCPETVRHLPMYLMLSSQPSSVLELLPVGLLGR
jgi:hypothetical protein